MYELVNDDRKQELCKTLASNMATLRKKVNLKQQELADRLGLSRQNISAIENGKQLMQWSTFSLLVIFFSKDVEVKQIMAVMGILTAEVESILDICAKRG